MQHVYICTHVEFTTNRFLGLPTAVSTQLRSIGRHALFFSWNNVIHSALMSSYAKINGKKTHHNRGRTNQRTNERASTRVWVRARVTSKYHIYIYDISKRPTINLVPKIKRIKNTVTTNYHGNYDQPNQPTALGGGGSAESTTTPFGLV